MFIGNQVFGWFYLHLHSIYLGCKLITILKHSLFCDRLQFEVLIFFLQPRFDYDNESEIAFYHALKRAVWRQRVRALCHMICRYDTALCCAVYCCILNWMSGFYSINTILLSLFHLLLYLSIVTTNELFKTVVAFFLFQTNHKYTTYERWNAMSEEESATNWKWLFEEINTEKLCHYIIYKINHRYGSWK